MIPEKIFDDLSKEEIVRWMSGLIAILDKRGVKIYNLENESEYLENIIVDEDKIQYISDIEEVREITLPKEVDTKVIELIKKRMSTY